MGDGNVSVAHSAPAKIDVGTVLELHVRVRDLTGRPLPNATVNILSRGAVVKTDNDGLAIYPGLTGLESVILSATYTPQHGAAAGSPVVTGVRAVPISRAYDATPADAAPGSGPFELHATILVPVYYPLKALFNWQNPIIRKKIFMAAVSVGQFLHKGDVDHPDKNRVLRLREIIQRLDPAHAELDEAQKTLDKSIAANVDAQKQIKKDLDKITADQARYDKNPTASGKVKLDNDKAALEKDQKALEASLDKLKPATDALNLSLATHGGTSHRQLMEYLIDKVLPRTDLEPWIRYGIIHLTGLRYRPSAGCCHPADEMVNRLRKKEIDELEHASSSSMSPEEYGKKQRGYAREYWTLLKNDSALAASAESFLSSQSQRVGVARVTKAVARLEKLAKSDGLWLTAVPDSAAPKPKKPPPKPSDLFDLRVIASAVTMAWSKQVGPVAKGSSTPRDENEFLGAILDRFWKKQIPEVVWRRAVMSTQLLHDFMDESWDTTPRDWNAPKVPSEWDRVFSKEEFDWLTHHQETQQPYITGVVCNDVASTLARSRGIALGGAASIEGIVARVNDAGKALAAALDSERQKNAALAAAAANDPNGQDQGAPPEPPKVVVTPTPSGSGFAGLYRPADIHDIKRGDFMFFAHWTDAADASWEVHRVVPTYITDLAPPAPESDPDNFGRSLREGIPEIVSLDEIQIPDHDVAFAVQTRRDGNLGNRIVRAWYRYPKGTPKPGAKDASKAVVKAPDPPVDPDKPPPPVQRTAVYESCTFLHIATVVDVLVGAKAVINFETNDPVGFRERGWAELSNPAYFLGRIPASTPPDLTWFLNRDNLLAKGRLDDG